MKFNGNRFSCELYIDTGDKEEDKQRFDTLHQDKEGIENKTDELSWERLDERKACRIAAYTDYTNDQEMLTWGIEKLKIFREVFKKHLV